MVWSVSLAVCWMVSIQLIVEISIGAGCKAVEISISPGRKAVEILISPGRKAVEISSPKGC